jgi:threonine synthase
MTESNRFLCSDCGQSYPLDTREWRCSCGGLFELETWPAFDAERIDPRQPGLWRYQALLPLEPAWEPVSLGEGNTPLVPITWLGHPFSIKLESSCPTGSFKDRGATVLVTALQGLGVEQVVEDSSGNAGASLAAYAAAAGIACELCVPDTAAGPKVCQMGAYGAEVIQIRGKRQYASLAAWAAAAHGAYYASHVYNPFFLAGTETVAYEIWEQMQKRAPGAIVVPAGNGTLLLGAYRGFSRLRRAGLIDQIPRIFGVQAAPCAPIYRAFAQGLRTVEPVPCEATSASGIAIGGPARGDQILEAVRDSGGALLAVEEEAIGQTRVQLAQRGFHMEDTSAVAFAVLTTIAETSLPPDAGPVVVLLTGHGLKTCPH